jgi:hypothetical protein
MTPPYQYREVAMRCALSFVLFLSVLGTVGVVGCGNEDTVELCAVEYDVWIREGSTEDPATWPNQEDIVGTYWLARVEIELYVDGAPAGFISGDDLGKWSGALVIEESALTATVTIEGGSAALSGAYTRTIEGETRGLFSISDPSGTYRYNYDLGENACPPEAESCGLLWYLTEPVCETTTL